jgi:Ca-activated chloride channel homolog
VSVRIRVASILALAMMSLAWPRAQEPVVQFRAGVDLVEVYATVTAPDGGLVTDLGRDDFEVRENGRPQAIAAFAAGTFPLTVALGIDRSWSMAGEPLRLARQAARGFLGMLGPADRSMVMAISSDAEIVAPIDMPRAAQLEAVAALDPWSTTAMHDAIIAMIDRLEHEPGRQAVIVVTDGEDRYSAATATDVVDRARRSRALVYPIGIGRTRPSLLAELAVVTGGQSFMVRDARELEPTLGTIARELRHQYLIGYVPAPPEGREWRSIEMTVPGRPDLRVRARDGYQID